MLFSAKPMTNPVLSGAPLKTWLPEVLTGSKPKETIDLSGSGLGPYLQSLLYQTPEVIDQKHTFFGEAMAFVFGSSEKDQIPSHSQGPYAYFVSQYNAKADVLDELTTLYSANAIETYNHALDELKMLPGNVSSLCTQAGEGLGKIMARISLHQAMLEKFEGQPAAEKAALLLATLVVVLFVTLCLFRNKVVVKDCKEGQEDIQSDFPDIAESIDGDSTIAYNDDNEDSQEDKHVTIADEGTIRNVILTNEVGPFRDQEISEAATETLDTALPGDAISITSIELHEPTSREATNGSLLQVRTANLPMEPNGTTLRRSTRAARGVEPPEVFTSTTRASLSPAAAGQQKLRASVAKGNRSAKAMETHFGETLHKVQDIKNVKLRNGEWEALVHYCDSTMAVDEAYPLGHRKVEAFLKARNWPYEAVTPAPKHGQPGLIDKIVSGERDSRNNITLTVRWNWLWQPLSNLEPCRDAVEEFLEKKGMRLSRDFCSVEPIHKNRNKRKRQPLKDLHQKNKKRGANHRWAGPGTSKKSRKPH